MITYKLINKKLFDRVAKNNLELNKPYHLTDFVQWGNDKSIPIRQLVDNFPQDFLPIIEGIPSAQEFFELKIRENKKISEIMIEFTAFHLQQQTNAIKTALKEQHSDSYCEKIARLYPIENIE